MRIYQLSLLYYQCDKCDKCWKTEETNCYAEDLIPPTDRIICPYCGYRNRIEKSYNGIPARNYRTFLEIHQNAEQQPSASLLSLSQLIK